MPGNLARLSRSIAHQTLAENRPIGCQYRHGLTPAKAAGHLGHPGRKQAFARTQRRHRTRVQRQVALRLHRVDPAFPRDLRVGGRDEPCPICTIGQSLQWARNRAFHDRHRATAGDGGLGGHQFGFHPALRHATDRIACHRLDLGRDGFHDIKAGGSGVFLGVGGVKPVDVGQKHQLVRPDRHRDLRGKAVVVAEPDFVRRNGIVLVYDRHDAQTQERLHRRA